jgi:hypothetical protein
LNAIVVLRSLLLFTRLLELDPGLLDGLLHVLVGRVDLETAFVGADRVLVVSEGVVRVSETTPTLGE